MSRHDSDNSDATNERRQESGESRSERPRREFVARGDRPQRNNDDRGPRGDRPFERRDDRGDRGFQRRDDRGDRGFQRRDDRGFGQREERGERRSFGDRNDRGFQRRDDRSEGFRGERGERGPRSFERRDDRGDRGFKRRDDRGFGQREERGERRSFGDRNDRGFQRRDDRNEGFRGERGERGDRGPRSFERRDDRGDRSFQRRDDRVERRSFGDRNDRNDRGFQRRDDRGPRGDRPFERRDDRGDRNFKPRDGERGGHRPEAQKYRKEESGYPKKRSFDRDSDRKPYSNEDRAEFRPFDDGAQGERTHNPADLRASNRPDRPKSPDIDPDVTGKELDRFTRAELRYLDDKNAEWVSKHLVMAARLMDEDAELAYQHALAASRRGGRVAVVREAVGLTAYNKGEYHEALRELRTFRRISGSNIHLALMADCERGLGRPEKALETIHSEEAEELDVPTKVELAIVASGAQQDLGNLESAIAELEIPQLDINRAYSFSPRLFEAYADVLDAAGRSAEATKWRDQIKVAEAALGIGDFEEPEIVDLSEDDGAADEGNLGQNTLGDSEDDGAAEESELVQDTVADSDDEDENKEFDDFESDDFESDDEDEEVDEGEDKESDAGANDSDEADAESTEK